MSYSAEQIERGKWAHLAKGSNKFAKKSQHRRQRRKMRANLEYVPRYNRYEGGWVL